MPHAALLNAGASPHVAKCEMCKNGLPPSAILFAWSCFSSAVAIRYRPMLPVGITRFPFSCGSFSIGFSLPVFWYLSIRIGLPQLLQFVSLFTDFDLLGSNSIPLPRRCPDHEREQRWPRCAASL